MARVPRDRQIIEEFIVRRAGLGPMSFGTPTWPEDVERNAPVVDCVVPTNSAGPFAIEHTEVLTYPEIIQDGVRFGDLIAPLEHELSGTWPGVRVSVTLPYAPGQRWPKDVAEKLREGLIAIVGGLETGTNHAYEYHDVAISGVPSPVRIWKTKSHRPGVYIGRFAPQGVPDDATLDATVKRGLDHKYSELAAFRDTGAKSVTLLENRDIALVNEISFYRAFLRVTWAEPHEALDEVWLLATWESTTERTTAFYCMRGPVDVLERANPEGFYFGPRYDDYWRGVGP